METKKQVEFGHPILNVGELRELIKDLDDRDKICIETCDENGDPIDLYPMYLDLYEGIKNTKNETIKELRFCQLPHENKEDSD